MFEKMQEKLIDSEEQQESQWTDNMESDDTTEDTAMGNTEEENLKRNPWLLLTEEQLLMYVVPCLLVTILLLAIILIACLLYQKRNRRKQVRLKVPKSGRSCPPRDIIPLTEKIPQRDPRDAFTPKETFAPRSPVILVTEQDGEDLLRPHRRIFRPDTREKNEAETEYLLDKLGRMQKEPRAVVGEGGVGSGGAVSGDEGARGGWKERRPLPPYSPQGKRGGKV